MNSSSLVEEFVRLQPAPNARRVAFRAGLSITIPLLAVIIWDQLSWAPYATFGAFVSLYARDHLHRSRAAMQAAAAFGLTLAVVAGAATAALDGSDWLLVAGGALVAGIGTNVSLRNEWHPPGSMFMVFAYGTVASGGGTWSDVPTALIVTSASGVFAIVVANPGVIACLYTRAAPHPRGQAPVWQVVAAMAAAALAGTVATLSGIGHADWAMIAAVAPLTAPGLGRQVLRAGHRVVGTIVGLLVAAPLLWVGFAPVPRVLAVAALLIATELVVGRNYGLAMLFVTPMALLMGQLAGDKTVRELVFDRGVETMLGGVAALTVIAFERSVRHRTSPPMEDL